MSNIGKNSNEKLLRGLSSLVTKYHDVNDEENLKLLIPYRFHKFLNDVQGERDFEARIGEAIASDPELLEHAVRMYNAIYEDEPIEISSVVPSSFKYRPLNAEGMTEDELNAERDNIIAALNLSDPESLYSNYYPSSEKSVLSSVLGYPYNKDNGYTNEKLSKYLLVQDDDDLETANEKTDRMRSLGFVNPEAYDRYVREVLGRSNDIYAFKNGNGVRNFAIDLVAPNVNKSHGLGLDASKSDIGADFVSDAAGYALGGVTKLPFLAKVAAQGFADAGAEFGADWARKKYEDDARTRNKRIYSGGSDYIDAPNDEESVALNGIVNAGLNVIPAGLGYGIRKKAKVGERIKEALGIGKKTPSKTAEQIAEENKAAVTKHFTEDRIGKGSVTRAVNKEMKSSTGAFGNAKKTIDSAKSSIGEIDTKLAELNKQGESLAMERYRLAQTHKTPENQKVIQGKINEINKKIKAIETEAGKLRVTRANHIKSIDTTVLPDTPNADAVRERVLQQKIEEALNDPEKLKKIIPVPEQKGKSFLDYLSMGIERLDPMLNSRGLNFFDIYGRIPKE